MKFEKAYLDIVSLNSNDVVATSVDEPYTCPVEGDLD